MRRYKRGLYLTIFVQISLLILFHFKPKIIFLIKPLECRHTLIYLNYDVIGFTFLLMFYLFVTVFFIKGWVGYGFL